MDEEELKDGEMPEGFHEETEADPLSEEDDDTVPNDPFAELEEEEEDPDAQEMFSVMYADYDER